MTAKEIRVLYYIIYKTGGTPEIKRRLRAAIKPQEPDRKIFYRKNENDCFYEFFLLPADVRTIEAAREFFDEFVRREYVPTYYDCTGQWFTSYAKFYDFGADGIACLHRIDCDC